MKRCPECRRDYYDDTLLYCLDDGNALLEGPATARPANDEPATAIFLVPPAIADDLTGATDEAELKTAILKPSATAGSSVPTRGFDKRLLLTPLALAIIVLSGFIGYRYFSDSSTKQINSIAVMPFENRNSDADTDYLSDGLAESVIFRLTQIADLKVSPTSSVMRYKGKETDVAKIASELGVDAVMTGRLTKRGDNLNITVELVDARTNKSLWGEQYERKLSELLTTQREIVTEIVGKLQLKLSGESEQKLTKNYTVNNEAYQLYLQGRYQWNRRETKAFEKAVEFFKQAIAKDPNYALAYSGLADTYALFPAYGNFRTKDYLPKAKEAAQKALELDPNLAEAHASLGQILIYGEYDFAGGERSYKRSIELNPKYATAHQWYGELLFVSGRRDEAFKELSKALELDPFSMIINKEMRKFLLLARRFDEALLQSKKVNELFPDEAEFHFTNAEIHELQGKYAEAFQEHILAAKIGGAKPEEIQEMQAIYEKGGWDGFIRAGQEQTLKSLNDEQAKNKNEYVPAMRYVVIYATLKDRDKTIEYLNKAFEENALDMTYLNVDPLWDFVRDDLRFKELVRRVRFPE